METSLSCSSLQCCSFGTEQKGGPIHWLTCGSLGSKALSQTSEAREGNSEGHWRGIREALLVTRGKGITWKTWTQEYWVGRVNTDFQPSSQVEEPKG